jgi:CubicO group peptidase (beta-lactamase class C family)
VAVDPDALARALDAAPGIGGMESAAVVRRGKLVGEWYRDGSPSTLRPVRSVTKSVISLLVGLAIERGIFQGTDEPLADTFHPPLPAITGPDEAITLDDLLTMTAGFEWDESNVAEFNAWVLAPDQVEYVLARPLVSVPGTSWNYDSAAVHLLSAALTSSTDAGTSGFADAVLLQPLGIAAREWELDRQGIPNGGAGLSLTARDLAKLGELVLQGGRSGSRQVVPADWIRDATSVRFTAVGGLQATGTLGYGRLWWLGQLGGKTLLLAWGYGGQFVAVLPETDLVVVTTAKFQGLGDGAPAQTSAIMDWIALSVLPAIR